MKLEYLQIGGSHKARAAKRLITDAEVSGKLKRDGRHIIIEKSGGNFGIGLATHAIPLGYPVKLLVRPSFSAFRRYLLTRLGVELIGQHEMKKGLSNQEIIEYYLMHYKNQGFLPFYSDQFNNDSCICAHAEAATEFIQQLESHGADKSTPIVLVKCVGSGASFSAYTSVFRLYFDRLRVVVAQPAGCDFRTRTFTDHPFQGASVGMVPPFFSGTYVDEYINVEHQEALNAVDDIFYRTGAFVGKTTGLAFAAAKSLSDLDKCIVALIAYDAGDAYAADSYSKDRIT